jgi:hypothetical protein
MEKIEHYRLAKAFVAMCVKGRSAKRYPRD